MKCNWKFIGLHGDKAAPESKFSVSPVLKELEMELKLAVPLDFFVITTRWNFSPVHICGWPST